MVFLEDEANPVPDFVKGEFVVCLHVDVRVRLAMLVHKIQADIVCISNQSLFFLDEQVSVLRHTLIDFLLTRPFASVLNIFFDEVGTEKTGVLEMLVSFLEVEELTLQIERSHEKYKG